MDETPAPGVAPEGTPDGPPTGPAPAPAPAPADQNAPPQTGMDGFFASIRRTGMVRSDERWMGGVAGGVALRLGIDPLIVRGLFGIGALLGGIGLLLYGVGWLLLPEQRDGRIHLQQLFRGDFDAAVIGGFVLLVLGFAFGDRWSWLGWSGDGGRWGGLIGLVAIGVIIALVVSSSSKDRPGAYTGAVPGSVPPPPRGTGGPTTTLRPAGPQYPAGVPAAAVHRPEGTTMYPAPPAPGAPTPAPQPPYGTAPWPAQAPAPTYRPLPPRPPLPPVPVTTVPRTKASGPGSRAVGIVAALGLITLAALLYAEREQAFDGPVLLTAAAVVVILCGAGIAIAGAMGRTSGGLGAIAIITVLVAVPVGAATNFRFDGTDGFVGEGAYTPRTLEAAEDGYSWTFGDVVVDLTEIPAGDVEEIPLHMGAGDLRVIVPEGTALTAEVRLGAGDVQWLGERKVSGVGNGWQTFESPAVRDGAEPELTLEISMGAGELTVVEG